MSEAVCKILVVEDDEGLNLLIKKKLIGEGYNVSQAFSGEDALKTLSTDSFDLILLDYILPDYSADELIATFEEEKVDTPFIVMTGHGDERIAVEMMKKGAKDYIIKDNKFLNILPGIAIRVFNELERTKRLHEAEKALEVSRERYRIMADNIGDGLVILENNEIVYFNNQTLKITGLMPEELLSINEQNEFFKQNAKNIESIMSILAGRISETQNDELWIVRPDGQKRYLKVKITGYEQGNKSFKFIIVEDATDEKLSENRMRESELKYRMVFEKSSLAIFTTTGNGQIQSYNRAARKIFGVESKELMGRCITSILPDVSIDREDLEITTTDSETNIPIGFEVETIGIHKNGRTFPVVMSVAKWETREGVVQAIILNDITLRRRYEDLLITSTIVSQILLHEDDFNVAITRSIEIMSNVVKVDRAHIFEIIHESEDRPLVLSLRVENKLNDGVKSYIGTLSDKDKSGVTGLERFVGSFKKNESIKIYSSSFPENRRKFLDEYNIKSSILVPILSHKRLWGFVGFDDCTTERIWLSNEESILRSMAENIGRRVERDEVVSALSNNRKLLATTLESVEEGVIVLDSKLNVVHRNSQFISIFEKCCQEDVYRGDISLFEKCFVDGSVFLEKLKVLSKSTDVFSSTIKMVNRRYLECYSRSLDKHNPEIGRILTFRDVTDSVRMEKAKRDFIDSVAHELRNPLVLIQGYTELLLDRFKKGTQEREMLDIIFDATKREIKRIAEFVDVGRTNPSYNFSIYNAFDVFSNIKQSLEIYTSKQVERIYDIRSYTFKSDVDEKLKDFYVKVDRDRILEILENLVTNSIKYSLPRNISIEFNAFIKDDQVVFTITDCGIGIPSGELPKIFKPFYQANRKDDLIVEGLGLGLANVKLHTESHNGKVEVTSEVGKGTTFEVMLPVAIKAVQ